MINRYSFQARRARKSPRRDRPSEVYLHGLYEWQLVAPYAQLTLGQKQFVDQMTDCAGQVHSQMRAVGLMSCFDIPDTAVPEAVNLIVNQVVDRPQRAGLQPSRTIGINFFWGSNS